MIVEAFGLEKNLMAVAFAELNDLVFDRRTVTRTALTRSVPNTSASDARCRE